MHIVQRVGNKSWSGASKNKMIPTAVRGGYLTKQPVMQLQLTADNPTGVVQLAK